MLLIDTHVLVWLDAGSPALGASARARIDEALFRQSLLVSAISFWEIAMLMAKQRLTLKMSPDTWRKELLAGGLLELPVDGDIGIAAGGLPDFHGDPADRIIAASALLRGATLVTADKKMLVWPRIETIDAER